MYVLNVAEIKFKEAEIKSYTRTPKKRGSWSEIVLSTILKHFILNHLIPLINFQIISKC